MNLARVLSRPFAPVEHPVSDKDCMLYALGLGLGSDPLAPAQLRFVYEKDLQVFPSMSSVIAYPGPWFMDAELEIDWIRLLHGEQSFTVHAPLRAGRTYRGTYRVLGVVDKGAGKGALVYFEKLLSDRETGETVATVVSTYFMRGDGGCGGTDYEPPPSPPAPRRESTQSIRIPTLPQAALIYRLSGDRNPIHGDPEAARKAGFERPILHGLCTFGLATRAVLDACCASEPDRLSSLAVRFSAPVYPGETLQVDLWREGSQVAFEAHVPERGVTVLRQGTASLRPEASA